MIKRIIDQLMTSIDNGKLIKKPFKWLYVLSGVFCAVPLLAGIGVIIWQWDVLFNLLDPNFWTDFVSILMAFLVVYALLIYAIWGWYFWKNRKANLDGVIPTGSRTVAIPLIAHNTQSTGEHFSLTLVYIAVVSFVLAYVACMLTNAFEFWNKFGFILYLIAGVVGIGVVALVAYLNLLFVRFLTERIRLLAQIGNDVHHMAISDEKMSELESDKEDTKFELGQLTSRQKKGIGLALGIALVVAFVSSLTISIVNASTMNKSIRVLLKEKRIASVERRNDGFESTCYSAYSTASELNDTKYDEITYGRLYKFEVKYMNNMDFINKIREKADEKYVATYITPNQARIDSLVAKWEKFIADHDPSKYIKVATHTAIYKEDGWYYTYDRPEFWFSVSEPKGQLKSASVTVKPVDRNGNSHYNVDAQTYSLSELKRYNSRSNSRYYRYVDNDAFWSRYSMRVTVNSVTLADGTIIKRSDSKQVPRKVKAYLEEKSEENLVAMVKSELIKDFPSREEYIDSEVTTALKAKDSLCYEFLHSY